MGLKFRPNSDTFRGIFGLPGQNQNESLHKTDCCNVLSDCCQEVCSAVQRRFSAATGATVRLWIRSGFFVEKNHATCIGPTIRIGRESWCLPYAGFFYMCSEIVRKYEKCKQNATVHWAISWITKSNSDHLVGNQFDKQHYFLRYRDPKKVL